MALTDVYNMLHGSGSSDLYNRVEARVLSSARYILGEAIDTPNHTARLAWAKYALTSRVNLAAKAEEMFIGVCGDTGMQTKFLAGTIADADIQYQVDTLVNTYA